MLEDPFPTWATNSTLGNLWWRSYVSSGDISIGKLSILLYGAKSVESVDSRGKKFIIVDGI